MSKHGKRVRVEKACDSCRVKKTKCNGQNPCEKCISNNYICTYTERNKLKDKQVHAEQVQLLENRLKLLTGALLNLSTIVKLNNTDLLDQFSNNIQFNADNERNIQINGIIQTLDSMELVIDQSVKNSNLNGITIDKQIDHSNNENSIISTLPQINEISSKYNNQQINNIQQPQINNIPQPQILQSQEKHQHNHQRVFYDKSITFDQPNSIQYQRQFNQQLQQREQQQEQTFSTQPPQIHYDYNNRSWELDGYAFDQPLDFQLARSQSYPITQLSSQQHQQHQHQQHQQHQHQPQQSQKVLSHTHSNDTNTPNLEDGFYNVNYQDDYYE